jgi:Ca2+/Na+ antiporter
MDIATSILIVVNLIAGLGCAIPVAKVFEKINIKQKGFFLYFAILIGIFLLNVLQSFWEWEFRYLVLV